jgi:phosphoglucosamine mutase
LGKKLFGTDGVRGVVGKTITTELAYKIGRAIPFLYDNSVDAIKVVVGKDTRVSSDMLESALVAGLLESGADVIKVGMMPSAGVAYLSKVKKANTGVMITASHNPAYYNGIKIFNGNGFKLTKMQELQIEELVHKNNFLPSKRLGQIKPCKKATNCYENYILSNASGFFHGLSVLVDCANGAGSKVFVWALKKLGARVKALCVSKNGENINKNCGATNTKQLCDAVKQGGFDVGFALDGDSDRLVIVDEFGVELAGERVLYLFATHLKQKNLLKNNTIVSTVMSNMALKEQLQKQNIFLITTPVGDENVVEAMLQNNLNFGGETSGHYLFENVVTTSDGILSAIQFLNLLKERGEKVSKLASDMELYPQKLINFTVTKEQKERILTNETLLDTIKQFQADQKNAPRILLRASGTEQVIRLLVEAKSKEVVDKISKNLEQKINQLLK